MPHHCPGPFPLLLAMWDPVEKELNWYVKMRVQSPVDRSIGAALTVMAKKPNNKIRCVQIFLLVWIRDLQ